MFTCEGMDIVDRGEFVLMKSYVFMCGYKQVGLYVGHVVWVWNFIDTTD